MLSWMIVWKGLICLLWGRKWILRWKTIQVISSEVSWSPSSLPPTIIPILSPFGTIQHQQKSNLPTSHRSIHGILIAAIQELMYHMNNTKSRVLEKARWRNNDKWHTLAHFSTCPLGTAFYPLPITNKSVCVYVCACACAHVRVRMCACKHSVGFPLAGDNIHSPRRALKSIMINLTIVSLLL